MKAGTMYDMAQFGRFTLVRIAREEPSGLPVWDVADVETGAIRQLDEDEIFAADELAAQIGQTWEDTADGSLVSLTSCRRSGGAWVWDAIEADGSTREVSDEALRMYYARIDGLDLDAPDRNCVTTPDGGCVGGPCMHDPKTEERNAR